MSRATVPPISRRGLSAYDYMNALRDSRTLNVLWDADVCEELRRFLSMENVAHVPLGTTPAAVGIAGLRQPACCATGL